MKYMKGLLDDWQAKGITSVLHEKKGGYANNTASIYGLAKKAEDEGVRIVAGVKVTGFRTAARAGLRRGDRQGHDRVRLRRGRCRPLDQSIWDMLDLPKRIAIKGRDGKLHDGHAACGPTGACRKARWASIRSYRRTTTEDAAGHPR